MFGQRPWYRCLLALFACIALLPGPFAYAKTAKLTAIEVYPAGNDQNVIQIADFILNGKNEVYLCSDAKAVDKREYHKLSQITLSAGMSLERNTQGILMLSNAPRSGCVVPGNLKLENGDALSLSNLAEKAIIEGTILPGANPPVSQIPALKPGVLIVFVASPDAELGNYLRAKRQGDIPGWKQYLASNATGAHVQDARKSLSALYQQQATKSFHAWKLSVESGHLEFAQLKDAKDAATLAGAQVRNDPGVEELNKNIHAEVLDLSRQSAAKLQLYQSALTQRTAGYPNLPEAEKLAGGAYSVEPSTPEAATVIQQTKAARESFDSTLQTVETRTAAGHLDEAAQAASPIQAFAPENPRLSSDIRQIATLLVERAQKSERAGHWDQAVADLQKAKGISATPELQKELLADQQQQTAAANQTAAQSAIRNSQDLQSSGDIIGAYEVLDNLPSAQHALVTQQLSSLQDDYVKAAETREKTLRKTHEPVNGIGDEQGIQQALELSQRCYRITEAPDLKDEIDVLSSDLAAYYLAQATKYAIKPGGSGANVAWTYVTEAWRYKSDSNSGQISDERERIRPAWNTKSALSISVLFHDSTSRRDSVDFATQLTEALATGLMQSDQKVVVEPAVSSPGSVLPNFRLVGDVLAHDLNKHQEVVLKQSKYRSGEQEVPNPKYVQISKEYDQARDQVVSDRGQLQQAQADHKKKDVKANELQLTTDTQAEKALLDKMGNVPQSNIVAIEEPYTYREVINHMLPKVQLQFRILDSASNEVVPEVPVTQEVPGEYDQLEDVQPTDTQGVHALAGIIPQDSDYFEKCEYAARDLLIKEARARVAGLPKIVFDHAERKVLDGDYDGAAELYILYLNSTADEQTPERAKANQFLLTHFNFRDLSLGVPAAK